MKKKELIKRYLVFLPGLMLNAFGVAFVTRSQLGASPIASIPFALSLAVPVLTMGNYVILFKVLLVALQWLILKDKAEKLELAVQVVLAFCFGYFTDFSLWILKDFAPSAYPLRLLSLLIGCFILGLGVYFELVGDVVMLPGNAFPKAIATMTGKKYGTIRVITDISMTVIAGVISLIASGKLSSVREGTIIAAFLVGNIVNIWNRLLMPLTNRLKAFIEK